MEWDDLRFLLALQRQGSLAAAARALGVNQTTVGRRLQALQRELGARLFERTGTGYRLTPAGLEACRVGGVMEGAAQALHREVAGRDTGVEGRVRITLPAGMVPAVGLALRELRRVHPALRFELLVDQASINLLQRQADIALRMAHPGQPSLIVKRLGELPWSLYASRSYLRQRGMPKRGFRGHDVIGFVDPIAKSPGGLWLAQHAREANVVAAVSNVISAVECAAAGMGITAAPRFIARRERDLELIPHPPILSKGSVYLVTLSDLVKVPRVRATLEALTRFVGGELEHLA